MENLFYSLSVAGEEYFMQTDAQRGIFQPDLHKTCGHQIIPGREREPL